MNIPLSLYIHLPWCIRKCPYCDFNSHTLKQALPEQAYIDKLLQDLKNDLGLVQKRKLLSIFIGGGTPSLFSATAIQYLLKEIHSLIDFEPNIEITLEANPGTVEQEKFIGFKNAGINRLSLGVQSFQSDKLKNLGRIHNGEEAIRAVITAKEAGFTNFNIDLMHGLPNQSLDDATYDLKTAFLLNPTHLSWYQLTLEPNTLFFHQPPELPKDATLHKIQTNGHLELLNNHLQHYEVSAYCQTGYVCKHNLNYWEFGDYIGIGAGAHSKITCLNTRKINRNWKIKNPKDYLNNKKEFIAKNKNISNDQIPFEFMLNTLRLQKPIPIQLFNDRTGIDIALILPLLKTAKDKNLLDYNEHLIMTTPLGKRYLNDLLLIFMP